MFASIVYVLFRDGPQQIGGVMCGVWDMYSWTGVTSAEAEDGLSFCIELRTNALHSYHVVLDLG